MQFKDLLQELFVHLTDSYGFFTVTNGGLYKKVEICQPMDIKNLHYSGTLVLANVGEYPEHGTLVTTLSIPITPTVTPTISTIVTLTDTIISSSHSATTRITTNLSRAVSTTSGNTRLHVSSQVRSHHTRTTANGMQLSVTSTTPSINSTPVSLSSPLPLMMSTHQRPLSSSVAAPLIGNITDDDTDLVSTFSSTETPRRIRLRLNKFTTERTRVLDSLDNIQELLINRKNIFQNALEQYQDPTILNCKVRVKFLNETGDDLDGLTREFFSLFWECFVEKYCMGAVQKYIFINPTQVLSPAECKAVGRILIHGFLLTGFLPLRINHALLFYLVRGVEPSDNLLMMSFLSSIQENERILLNDATSTTDSFDERMKLKIAAFFSFHEFPALPSPETIKESIHKVARYTILIKPCYYLCQIKEIAPLHIQSWLDMLDEAIFQNYLARIRPSGVAIVPKLKPLYSSDAICQVQEEVVYDYFVSYVSSLSLDTAALFLKFVSGFEVLGGIIFVDFHGEDKDEAMIPTAHTCTSTIHLSRYFLNQQSLSSHINNVLNHSQFWQFDMI